MLIHDMNNGDRFEGYYILQNIAQRTTAAGKPFLTLNLVDRSGSVTAQVWDYTGPISQSDVGKVAWIAACCSRALCFTTCASARSLSPRLWAWWRSIR